MKLLYVEDDAFEVKSLQRLIQREQLDIDLEVARDGVEALARLRELPVDALLLDLNLPRMDGHELLEALGPTRPARIIVLSTSSAQDDRDRARRLGADDYYVKETLDIDGEPLRSTLRALVERFDAPPTA